MQLLKKKILIDKFLLQKTLFAWIISSNLF